MGPGSYGAMGPGSDLLSQLLALFIIGPWARAIDPPDRDPGMPGAWADTQPGPHASIYPSPGPELPVVAAVLGTRPGS